MLAMNAMNATRTSGLGLLAASLLFLACTRGRRALSPPRALRRARRRLPEPARPKAYMYPAENRTSYGPDDPEGRRLPDCRPGLPLCCPDVPRATDC